MESSWIDDVDIQLDVEEERRDMVDWGFCRLVSVLSGGKGGLLRSILTLNLSLVRYVRILSVKDKRI